MLLTIIIFVLILGFLIFIHEFGHFISAKKMGVRVEEFGIGFPPSIWKKKIGETVYSINLIPLGGFVKLYGEGGEGSKDSKSFSSKSLSQKTIMILSGTMMNFILAVILFYFLLAANGFQSQFLLIFDYQFPFGNQQKFTEILAVAENSPAQKAGLEPEDIILKAEENEFKNSIQLIQFINQNKGREITLTLKKAGSEKIEEIKIIPRIEPPQNEGALGVALGDMIEVKYGSFWQKTTSGFLHSLNLSHLTFVGLGYYVKTSFIQKDVKPLASSVVGPVGILALTKLTLSQGFEQLIFLLALISLALALINVLPLPPLDGGIILLILSEAITGRKISAKTERRIQEIGFIFFIVLFILIAFKDFFQFKDILF